MKEFDKYVKDGLYSYKSPVPEGLWERIVAEKDKKKPIPIPFWKNGYFQASILALVTIALTSSSYFFFRKENTTYINNTTKEVVTLNNNITSNTKESNHKVESAEANKSNTLSIVSTDKVKNNVIDIERNNKPLSRVNHTISNAITAASVSKANVIKESNKPQSNIISSVAVNKEENKTVENTIPNTDEHYFEKGSIINRFNSVLANRLVSKALNGSKKTITTIHLPDRPTRNWYLEVYGSSDYDTKQVNSNSLDANYLHILDSTQKLVGGFTFGIRLSKNINQHLSIKSGVQFKEVTQQFKFTQQNVTKSITVITNAGTNSYIETGYQQRTVYNNYKSIEVPVIASLEMDNTKKWHFYTDGGVILNLTSFYHGITFDPSLNNVPLSAKQTYGMFSSNVNLSLYGGFSVLHNINKNIEAFAGPYCSYSLSNNNISSVGYNQRFNVFGVNLGIRYKISHSGNKAK